MVEFQAIYEQSLHQRKQKVELMRKRVAEIEKATEERESKKQQGLTEGEIMEDVGRDHLKLQGLDLQLEPPAGKEALNVFRNHADMIKREQQIIKALKEKEESMPSPHLLRQWYKLDDNCRPPVYRLQNIR